MAGPMVTADVIRSARSLHPTFDKNRHPDRMLVETLSRYQRELLARIIRLDDSLAVTFFDTPLPLADFDSGIALPAYKYPSSVEVTHVGAAGHQRVATVDLVPWQDHKAYHGAAYIRNGVLYLTGRAQSWAGFSNVRFYYIPEPDAVDLSLEGTLDFLPQAAEPVVVAYLCKVMAGRGGHGPNEVAPNVGQFTKDWRDSESYFFDEIGHHTQAVVSTVKDHF